MLVRGSIPGVASIRRPATVGHGDLSLLAGIPIGYCLQRASYWPAPPNWTAAEWRRELAAQGNAAALEASREYDSSRETEQGVFVISRVMGRLLTHYRQEWNFAQRIRIWPIDSEELVPADATTEQPSATLQNIRAAIRKLREPDRWLIIQLFWRDRDQTEVARELGISQPAVSKRYRRIVRQLRCFLLEA